MCTLELDEHGFYVHARCGLVELDGSLGGDGSAALGGGGEVRHDLKWTVGWWAGRGASDHVNDDVSL